MTSMNPARFVLACGLIYAAALPAGVVLGHAQDRANLARDLKSMAKRASGRTAKDAWRDFKGAAGRLGDTIDRSADFLVNGPDEDGE